MAFFILLSIFYFKSFYPYTFSFQSGSVVIPFTSVTLLDQKLKVSLSDGEGGSFYIDSIQKDERGGVSFFGRYNSVHPAAPQKTLNALKDVISLEVGEVFAENACVVGIDLNQPGIREQVKIRNEKMLSCIDKVKTEFIDTFDISYFNLAEGARLKKIFFLALVIAVFFGGVSYILLESFNVFKKD